MARARGDILYLDKTIELTLSLALEHRPNNHIETYALLLDLILAQERQITSLSIIGHSHIIMHSLIKETLPKDLILKAILKKI